MLISKLKVTGLTFLIFLVSHFIFGQNYRAGYVVKSDGDSLNGFVHYVSGNSIIPHCSFKLTKGSEAMQFTPSELDAFGIYGDNVWISMIYPGVLPEKSFVRVLVTGPMSLYRYGETFIVKKQELIELPYPTTEVVTTEDGLASRQNNRYVGLLNSLVADCGLTANSVKYTESQITSLVHKYNRCKGVETREQHRNLTQLNYGFSIGYLTSSMKPFEPPAPGTFTPANTVCASLLLEYSSPRKFDHLFFTMEASYFSASYFSHIEFHTGNGPNYTHSFYDITLNTKNFRVPLGMMYKFLPDRSTPYLKVGVTLSLIHDVDEKTIEEITTAGNTETKEHTGNSEMTKAPHGVWLALGYNQRATKKTQVFFEVRYEKTNAFLFTPMISFSKMTNFSVSTGLRF